MTNQPAVGVQIGGAATDQALLKTILAILNTPHADEATKVAALAALQHCTSTNANVSNVHVDMSSYDKGETA